MTRRYSDHELFTIYTNPQGDVPEDATADDMAQYNEMASALYDQQVAEERARKAHIVTEFGEKVHEVDTGSGFTIELWYVGRDDFMITTPESWHEIRRGDGEYVHGLHYIGALSELGVRDSWHLDSYQMRGLEAFVDSDGYATV